MISPINIFFISISIWWTQRISKLIEPEWRFYASVKYTIIGSDNGMCLDSAKPLSEPMLEYC